MTILLQFPKHATSRSARVPPLQSAEIVIFPGVRFERRNFEAAANHLPARKRRASQAAIDEETLDLT